MLGLSAMNMSPAQAFETVMKPKLRELLAARKVTNEDVERALTVAYRKPGLMVGAAGAVIHEHMREILEDYAAGGARGAR